MKHLKFFIETHGCQMNEHDTEKISGLLLQYGMLPAAGMDEADLILLNTCSVREKASHKVFSRLGELRILKSGKPGLVIGVAGCVAQQEGDRITRKAPHVDFVVGTHQYHTIPEILDGLPLSSSQVTPAGQASGLIRTEFTRGNRPTEISEIRRGTSYRANITIMEGCNKKCSYCIVPYTRGREMNRPTEKILADVREAVARGYSEIQLLGQTVTSYRDPEDETFSFFNLLRSVSNESRIRRIRFVSPHPINFTDELIALIAERENICNQVHLPLQSGSNEILRRMRRLHTREWYLELIGKFRDTGRHIALSTDIITGFPGESDRDFEDTLDIVRRARFEQMFSFKYSARPYTEAAEWKDSVPEEMKSERLSRLQELQRNIQVEEHQRLYSGRIFEVLVEGRSKDGKLAAGRTTTNKVVNFDSAASPGTYVQVKIEKSSPNSLYGIPIYTSVIPPDLS